MTPGIDYIGITTPFYCNDGQGNFLLHRRSQNCRDEQGVWDTGGGKLEFGFTPEQNVLQEVAEEYGCVGQIQAQMKPYSNFRELNGQKTHWLAIPFFIKVEPYEVKNNEPEKIDELDWFRIDNFPEPLHTGVTYSLRAYKEYFEKFSDEISN